jgi:hypothetical protein
MALPPEHGHRVRRRSAVSGAATEIAALTGPGIFSKLLVIHPRGVLAPLATVLPTSANAEWAHGDGRRVFGGSPEARALFITGCDAISAEAIA